VTPGEILLDGTDAQRYDFLATVDAATYDRLRDSFAKRMGIRISTLDLEVQKLRAPETGQSTVLLSAPEPWPHPVDGAELLNLIVDELQKYMAMPNAARHAVALWILMSYAIDALFIAPLLVITSPQKRCGKSTLLILLRKLCFKGLLVSSTSPGALFRIVEKHHPTLLLDEADAWAKDNEPMRGVLNCGHSRETAQILRCDGDDNEPRIFDLFCPKALAGIGSLADTVHDRAVIIEMKRRGPGEPVAQLRQDRLDFTAIQSMAARWATDHIQQVKHYDPAVPVELNDRAADNWRPLTAIADLAGGDWPKRARSAAISLCARDNDDDDIKVLLLGDIRGILNASLDGRVPSHDLVQRLAELEDRPWSEWKLGRPMTTVQLARQLKPFGIATRNIKLGHKVVKAYVVDAFSDAFSRYLKTTDSAATPLPTGNFAEEVSAAAATDYEQVADRSATATGAVAAEINGSAKKTSLGSAVADQIADMEQVEL
jgi:putative DNA primase/helicase